MKSNEQLLLEILNELKLQSASDAELWTADDIAKYLRLTLSSVQSRIICRKDFSRPIRIPTENGSGGRRWYSREVKAWIAKNRDTIKR